MRALVGTGRPVVSLRCYFFVSFLSDLGAMARIVSESARRRAHATHTFAAEQWHRAVSCDYTIVADAIEEPLPDLGDGPGLHGRLRRAVRGRTSAEGKHASVPSVKVAVAATSTGSRRSSKSSGTSIIYPSDSVTCIEPLRRDIVRRYSPKIAAPAAIEPAKRPAALRSAKKHDRVTGKGPADVSLVKYGRRAVQSGTRHTVATRDIPVVVGGKHGSRIDLNAYASSLEQIMPRVVKGRIKPKINQRLGIMHKLKRGSSSAMAVHPTSNAIVDSHAAPVIDAPVVSEGLTSACVQSRSTACVEPCPDITTKTASPVHVHARNASHLQTTTSPTYIRTSDAVQMSRRKDSISTTPPMLALRSEDIHLTGSTTQQLLRQITMVLSPQTVTQEAQFYNMSAYGNAFELLANHARNTNDGHDLSSSDSDCEANGQNCNVEELCETTTSPQSGSLFASDEQSAVEARLVWRPRRMY